MTKVLICVGPGGVGKTTVAAALAVRSAKAGKKTLVLTIDPSKRLASTLGVSTSGDPIRVPGADYSGELWAGTVDHRRTFDDFVRRAAGRNPSAERILNNRLYQQLTSTLSGSQDFTALEKLYSSARDGDYDLIVLDTPPAQHALDFLQAPAKIAALFNEGVAKWFRDPSGAQAGFLQKIVGVGTRQIFKVLESLTGSEFLKELADFFRQIESWQGKLEERTLAVHRLLVSPETEFYLITAADRAKLGEAENFARQLRKGGHHLTTVVLNRAVPEWWSPKLPAPPAPLTDLMAAFDRLVRQQLERVATFASQLKGEVRVARLPEWDDRIYDLKGLERVSLALDKELTP